MKKKALSRLYISIGIVCFFLLCFLWSRVFYFYSLFEKDAEQILIEVDNKGIFIQDVQQTFQNNILVTLYNGEKFILEDQDVASYYLDKTKWEASFSLENGKKILIKSIWEIWEYDVILNPYRNAPLSAELHVEMPIEWKFSINVLWKWKNGIAIQHNFNTSSKKHILPILGLYPDYKNQVKLSYFSTDGTLLTEKIIEIQTEKIDEDESVDLHVLKNTLPNTYRGLYTFVDKPVLFDQNGEIRWYLHWKNFWKTYGQLKNGNILVESTKDKIFYHASSFSEITLTWKVIQEYIVPKKFHHEIIEDQDRNFLILGSSQDFKTMADTVYRDDTIVKMERETGKIIYEFNLDTVLPGIRPSELKVEEGPFPGWVTTGDWAHANSLFLHGDNMILSLRTPSMIISMNKDTFKLNWVFSREAENHDSTKNFALKILNQSSDIRDYYYPLFQHSAFMLDNGNLVLFDNGTWRYSDNNSWIWDISRVVEYRINQEEKTAEMISQYVHPNKVYTAFAWNVKIPSPWYKLIGFTNSWKKDPNNIYPKLVEITDRWQTVLEIEDRKNLEYYRVDKIQLY